MVYIGAKTKYTKYIIPILQKLIDDNNIICYIEPFCGGANVIDKIKCQNKYAYDKNYSLIALHRQAQIDFAAIPEHGDSDWWYAAKDIYRKHNGKPADDEMEGWKIGAIAFLGSFNRGGFSYGYAKNKDNRDYYNEAYKNLQEQSLQPLYQDIVFNQSEYDKIIIPDRSLIYCDPPYKNTKTYGYKFETEFDYDAYYNWVREISKKNIVVCSEQEFPEDFNIIWTQDVKRIAGKDNNFKAVEKLAIIDNRA